MRGTIAVALVLALSLTAVCTADQVQIQRVDRAGNLMVPVRTIFEPFGYRIGWDSQARAVTVTDPARNIVLRQNSEVAVVNGVRVMLPVPTEEIEGRAWVAFSFAERILEGKVQYRGDRIEMPTVGRTVMLRGPEVVREPEHMPPPPPVISPATDAITITRPRDGDRIGSRVEMRGTAPPGSLVIIETEVRRQRDDELLRVVPGIRNQAPETGRWRFAVAAPALPPTIAEPLYYVINARYRIDGRESEPVSVRVYRAE